MHSSFETALAGLLKMRRHILYLILRNEQCECLEG